MYVDFLYTFSFVFNPALYIFIKGISIISILIIIMIMIMII